MKNQIAWHQHVFLYIAPEFQLFPLRVPPAANFNDDSDTVPCTWDRDWYQKLDHMADSDTTPSW